MLVRDAGEFRLIGLLSEILLNEGVDGLSDACSDEWRLRIGIGDDAAVWDDESGTRVFSTDAMVEGVHFDLTLTGWRDLGWKAMAVNLSDIAAMGCLPGISAVTLGLRDDLPVDGLVEMYRGIAEACRSHGGGVVGGDVVRSPVFFVSVSMEGRASIADRDGRGAVLTRSAAEVGDVIAVTGSIGDSAGGLRMALAGEPFDDSTARLHAAHFRPEPRISVGQALTRAGIKAAIDISDGLTGDLAKLCEAAGVGAIVRASDLPVSDTLRSRFGDDWLSLALSGGEDYELLFTAPEDAVRDELEAGDIPVTIIGEIVEASRGVTVVDAVGNAVLPRGDGWDHFAAGRKRGNG